MAWELNRARQGCKATPDVFFSSPGILNLSSGFSSFGQMAIINTVIRDDGIIHLQRRTKYFKKETAFL